MRYQINSTGNIILADQAFMDANYPNDYTLLPDDPVPPPVYAWYIDLGPFYDRFGATKMAVLTSADAGIKAIIADVNIRKWVDLQRADVAESLVYIGTKVPSVTTTLQTAILTTPVTAEEQQALVKTYFT
jgi:hypothetical protein